MHCKNVVQYPIMVQWCTIVLLLCTVVTVHTRTSNGPPVIKDQPESAVVRRNDPYTLNCDADKATHIRWYHNGQQITDTSSDANSHRILLPNGSLFFLRVAATKKVNDAGVYWCVAYNSEGATKSRNATIEVAYIEDDFLEYPESNIKVLGGQPLTLPCVPPKGSPDPEVYWLKDGARVEDSSRMSVVRSGDLFFRVTIPDDSGLYECKAENAAGIKSSSPSSVIIMEAPAIVSVPRNKTVTSGTTVSLPCEVTGSPTPKVNWRRLDGKIPLQRSSVSDDYTLQLTEVSATDSGHYVCSAESEAGSTSADVHILVLALPRIKEKPNDQVVKIGATKRLVCSIEGDPAPLLLWRLPGDDRSNILSIGGSKGSMNVQQDGSLLMEDLQLTDTGVYTCMATNSGGGVSARAKILTVEAFPPPVVGIAPQDQLITDGDTISLPCEPVCEFALPTVTWWFREAAHISESLISSSYVNGIAISPNGALAIRNATRSNSGIYTCRVSSETGVVEATAVVRYDENYASHNLINTALPDPPSKPKVRVLNETSVRLTWQPNSRVIGKKDSVTYMVEYWRQGWNEWRIANSFSKSVSVVISELESNYTYTFLVRSVKGNGQSFPSPWSNPVRLEVYTNYAMLPRNKWLTDRRLDKPTIALTSAIAGSSRSVLLTWEGLTTENKENGVLVYRISYTDSSDGKSTTFSKAQVATVLGSTSSSHLVRGLEPYTHYTFFLVPFWDSIEGNPTNSISLRTPEDIPSAAPQSLLLTFRSPTKALVTWDEVDSGDIPGQFIGYAVVSSCNGTVNDYNVTTPWLEINNILPGCLLTARVAAMTNIGVGPFSAPALLQMSSHEPETDVKFIQTVEQDVVPPSQHIWVLYLLLPVLVAIIVCLVLYVRGYLRCYKSSGTHDHSNKCRNHSVCSSHCHVNMYGEHQKTWSVADTPQIQPTSCLLRHNHYINDYAEPGNLMSSDGSHVEAYTTTALMAHHNPSGNYPGQWTSFSPPPPPQCPPPPIIGQYSGGTTCSSSHSSSGDSYRPRGVGCYRSRGAGVSQSSDYNSCYRRPCDEAASEHTYEVYNHHRPPDEEYNCSNSSCHYSEHSQSSSSHTSPVQVQHCSETSSSVHHNPSVASTGNISSASSISKGAVVLSNIEGSASDVPEVIPLRISPIESNFPTFSSLNAAAASATSAPTRTDQRH